MARYLAEVYMTRRVAGARGRARRAERSLDDHEGDVRLLRDTFIPADETWLLFYSAPSADAVAAVLDRAGITPNRLVETA